MTKARTHGVLRRRPAVDTRDRGWPWRRRARRRANGSPAPDGPVRAHPQTGAALGRLPANSCSSPASEWHCSSAVSAAMTLYSRSPADGRRPAPSPQSAPGRAAAAAGALPTGCQPSSSRRTAATSPSSESSNPVNTGDHVQVSYDPGNPSTARDLSAGAGNTWMLMGLGALANPRRAGVLPPRNQSAARQAQPHISARRERLGRAQRPALGPGNLRRHRRRGCGPHSPAPDALTGQRAARRQQHGPGWAASCQMSSDRARFVTE